MHFGLPGDRLYQLAQARPHNVLHFLVILTRGMGKRLTYGILARYRVVLVERLGGLFFDGERSCAGDSFAGHSGLYCCESLVVSILFCV